MWKQLLFSLIVCVTLFRAPATTAQAAEKVKVITFTATWCNVCQIMDPRLQSALAYIGDPAIHHYPVDLTLTEQGSDQDRVFFRANFRQSLADRGISAIYDGYMGYPYTGYSVILSADTNEPLGCFVGLVDMNTLIARLKAARALTNAYSQRARTQASETCPTSFNYLKRSF